MLGDGQVGGVAQDLVEGEGGFGDRGGDDLGAVGGVVVGDVGEGGGALVDACPVQLRFLQDDGLLQGDQFGAGLDAQFLGQQPPQPPVGPQRVDLAAAAVQGQHQLAPPSLPQRLLAHHCLQFGHHLAVAAEGQLGVDP